jgi:hypothetical protein
VEKKSAELKKQKSAYFKSKPYQRTGNWRTIPGFLNTRGPAAGFGKKLSVTFFQRWCIMWTEGITQGKPCDYNERTDSNELFEPEAA